MKALVAAAIAVTTLVFGMILLYERSLRESDPVGFRNLQTCRKLKPGIFERDLLAAFGPAERIETPAGGRRLCFHTHETASAPINADVDPATGKVVVLRCREGDKPTWEAGAR